MTFFGSDNVKLEGSETTTTKAVVATVANKGETFLNH